MSTKITPISEADYDWVLELSRAHEVETAPLDRAKLARFHSYGFHWTKIGERSGYLFTYDQDAAYQSPNFLWFRTRYAKFAYIDRIVIDPSARRLGYAETLYRDFFDVAAKADHDVACCEVNIDPPNPGSDAFHARLGFSEVGRETMADKKTVRFMTRPLERQI